jgi:UDP-3-O-[3-hydroxymyristoyl] glucosamine N-acyltransferase
MKDGIVIVGAGAHARKLWLYARLIGLPVRAFFDEDPTAVSPSAEIPCVHPDELSDLAAGQQFIVAIGNSTVREQFQESLKSQGWVPLTLVHPSAYVAKDAQIGAGSVISAMSVVETGAILGVGCIVDIGVSIDHDCSVGNYCHLTAGIVLPPYTHFN